VITYQIMITYNLVHYNKSTPVYTIDLDYLHLWLLILHRQH